MYIGLIRDSAATDVFSYMGRSTGAGAISVWMHHLKELQWLDNYVSPGYRGPALKVQAGVQGAEVNAEATKHGHIIVAGECPVSIILFSRDILTFS